MGKRKQRPDLNKTPPPSDVKSFSSRMDSISTQRSSHAVDRHSFRPLSSIMDIMDKSTKPTNAYHSHQSLSRSLFQNKPQNYCGRHYSRRSLLNCAGASSSDVKTDGKIWSRKATIRCDLDSRHPKGKKEKLVCIQENTQTSFLTSNAASTETVKICSLCQRSLKKKPHIFKNGFSSGDISVIAVLVCGHIYHADCLEQRTCHEEIRDPSCPICAGQIHSFMLK